MQYYGYTFVGLEVTVNHWAIPGIFIKTEAIFTVIHRHNGTQREGGKRGRTAHMHRGIHAVTK